MNRFNVNVKNVADLSQPVYKVSVQNFPNNDCSELQQKIEELEKEIKELKSELNDCRIDQISNTIVKDPDGNDISFGGLFGMFAGIIGGVIGGASGLVPSIGGIEPTGKVELDIILLADAMKELIALIGPDEDDEDEKTFFQKHLEKMDDIYSACSGIAGGVASAISNASSTNDALLSSILSQIQSNNTQLNSINSTLNEVKGKLDSLDNSVVLGSIDNNITCISSALNACDTENNAINFFKKAILDLDVNVSKILSKVTSNPTNFKKSASINKDLERASRPALRTYDESNLEITNKIYDRVSKFVPVYENNWRHMFDAVLAIQGSNNHIASLSALILEALRDSVVDKDRLESAMKVGDIISQRGYGKLNNLMHAYTNEDGRVLLTTQPYKDTNAVVSAAYIFAPFDEYVASDETPNVLNEDENPRADKDSD